MLTDKESDQIGFSGVLAAALWSNGVKSVLSTQVTGSNIRPVHRRYWRLEWVLIHSAIYLKLIPSQVWCQEVLLCFRQSQMHRWLWTFFSKRWIRVRVSSKFSWIATETTSVSYSESPLQEWARQFLDKKLQFWPLSEIGLGWSKINKILKQVVSFFSKHRPGTGGITLLLQFQKKRALAF